MTTSRLVESLAEVCRQYLLQEKWLLAPSRRVSYQWLDAVSRAGQTVVNVHVKTLRSLAVDLASPEMTAKNLRLLTGRAGEMLADRVFRKLKTQGLDYLGELQPSTGLAQVLHRTIQAIRLAGLNVGRIPDDRFEVITKGRDVRKIVEAYLDELNGSSWTDYAGALRLAIENVQSNPRALARDVLVLVPEDLIPHGIECNLLGALPPSQRLDLPVDQPFEEVPSETPVLNDLALLRWLPRPAEAPSPFDDDSVKFFHAVGEINEVREVLRRLVAEGIPLDEAELLHTDVDAYVPLVYETFAAVIPDDGNLGDELPVTFADGIPVRFFRPGRLLGAWVAWVREGFPQNRLVAMVREGLLTTPEVKEARYSYSRLAVLLRNLGIGFGKDRYLVKLDEEITAVERRLQEASEAEDNADEQRKRPSPRRLEELRVLRALVEALLAMSPAPEDSQGNILDCALRLLETLSRSVNKSDNFARQRLIEDITELRSWLDDASDPAAIDVWSWLSDLPREARVLGSGPRPGCLHVAGVSNGGYTGRGHTFLVGLDDGRLPGGGSQDPLLLDWEREKICPELPTAAGQLAERLSDFYHLVARLRGKVTLSFSSRNLADDKEKFPSSLLLSAWRIVAGDREGSQEDFLKWLASPVSFAPANGQYALDLKDWWLQQLCVGEPVQEAEQLVLASYPHLAQGRDATEHRSSAEFTVFDGRVEQAGADLDPTRDKGPIMSSGRLEMIGQCPLRFFFHRGLGIEPPEELELDPTRWLDPLAAGSMLHEVFEQFVRELVERDELPQFPQDLARLEAVLDARAGEYRDLYPPLSEHLFATQISEFRQVVRTFLVEETRYCRQTGNRPAYLEASLGMSAGDHGTAIDTDEPIPVHLPDGTKFFVRGRVDRIDCVDGGAVRSYAIWDYKTGSAWKYDPLDPFREGRVVQPAVYLAMVGHRLKDVVKGKKVDIARFGFFFPGRRERGRRIEWTAAQLHEGPQVLSRLVQIVRNGAFVATDEAGECRYCDYKAICGDVETLAETSTEKLANPENNLLDPLKELRGYGKTQETS